MNYLADVGALARKDLRLELRARDTLPAMALFVVSTLVVFHFALPAGADELAAHGLLWVALVFTSDDVGSLLRNACVILPVESFRNASISSLFSSRKSRESTGMNRRCSPWNVATSAPPESGTETVVASARLKALRYLE